MNAIFALIGGISTSKSSSKPNSSPQKALASSRSRTQMPTWCGTRSGNSPSAICSCSSACRLVLDHLLVDGAEDRLAGRVEHLHADAVAELEILRLRPALLDILDRAALGDAGGADLAVVGVRDGARAEQRPGRQLARVGGVGDQLRRTSSSSPSRWRGRTACRSSSTWSGRQTRPSFQASPSSSGVTATGDSAVLALAFIQPKPTVISRLT